MTETLLLRYLPIIRNHIPGTAAEDVKAFYDGHDHYVFVAGATAFRIPRSTEHGQKDVIENVFLPEFSKTSPLPIQVFSSHMDNDLGITYQTYNFISGESFTKEIANEFSADERIAIAKQIGNFLKVLHNYPIEKAKSMKMDELDPKGYYDFFESIWPENKKVIYPLLSKKEQEWCDELFRSYLGTREEGFIPQVTHNDMLPEHIIVDTQEHTLSGIIDFSLRIADPARDFMFLHIYGENILRIAIEEYGKIDTNFFKRRIFYGGNFYIMYFYNAITRNLSQSEIIKHKNNLSHYIAEYKAS